METQWVQEFSATDSGTYDLVRTVELVHKDQPIPVSKCGRYPGFQVTGMMEWGQKSKPKNILDQHLTPQKSHAKFLSNKNFQKALNDVAITNLHIVLITPKNPYLNEGSQKNTCQNFPTQILKSKISNPKNPLIIPAT